MSGRPGQVDDYWIVLRLGTAISRAVLAPRWPTVATLLRFGVVESWRQLGDALDMLAPQVRATFRRWLSEQVDLFRHTRVGGLSPAAEAELLDQIRAVRINGSSGDQRRERR